MNHNNHKRKEYAQTLRKNMTKQERRLWYDCFKQMAVTIKRQHVIDPYIVDFYCAAAKLVVEVDGSQHYEQTGKHQDQERDVYLNSLGLMVKRYSNREIDTQFSNVCEDLYETIRTRKSLLLEEKVARQSRDG